MRSHLEPIRALLHRGVASPATYEATVNHVEAGTWAGKRYACKLCGSDYDTPEALGEHYRELHPQVVQSGARERSEQALLRVVAWMWNHPEEARATPIARIARRFHVGERRILSALKGLGMDRTRSKRRESPERRRTRAWIQSHREEMDDLTITQVADACRVSRKTASDLLREVAPDRKPFRRQRGSAERRVRTWLDAGNRDRVGGMTLSEIGLLCGCRGDVVRRALESEGIEFRARRRGRPPSAKSVAPMRSSSARAGRVGAAE